jgi:hypothetical protein
MYYSWSKEFLEAGKRRLAGDTAQQPFFQSDRSRAFSWSDSANGKPVKE